MPIIAQDSNNIPRLLLVESTGRLLSYGVTSGSTATALLVRSDGSLITDGKDNTYHYVAIADDTSGTTGTIWDPAAGKQIHVRALWVSVTGAGTVEIYDNATGTTIVMMDFAGKKGEGITFRGGILLTADNILGAKFTCDAGTETAHVSAMGHED